MKILVVIPHYYRHDPTGKHGSLMKDPAPRIDAFSKCISSIHQHLGSEQLWLNPYLRDVLPANHAGQQHIDIMVCTTGKQHLLDVISLSEASCIHIETKAEPQMLGFECASVMRDHIGKYDYYCYMEDDLIIYDPLFIQKIKWFTEMTDDSKLLQPNRYELNRQPPYKKCYIDGYAGNIMELISVYDTEGPEFSSNFWGKYFFFQQPSNPHSGCYFLNASQFEYWVKHPCFGDRDTRFVGPLESAASLGIMKIFNIYKPVPDNAYFLELEHFDEMYISKAEKSWPYFNK